LRLKRSYGVPKSHPGIPKAITICYCNLPLLDYLFCLRLFFFQNTATRSINRKLMEYAAAETVHPHLRK
jgi:hypothetical protein